MKYFPLSLLGIFIISFSAQSPHCFAQTESARLIDDQMQDLASLRSFALSDSDIIAVNSEEITDIFRQVAGFQHFDLGALGQFSTAGYLGTAKESVIPILNGIPLETESFGTWNWQDLPINFLEKITFQQDSSTHFSNIFQPVYFTTKSIVPDIPFSQVNYRVGDFEWRHTEVSLTRNIFKGISFYGTGVTERFPDKLGDNRYRGSNIWINLSKSIGGYDVAWNALSTDKNTREVTVFPSDTLSAIKNMPHSHNVKMTSLQISDRNGSRKDRLQLYYWTIKDNAQGSLLYNGDFRNSDRKTGLSYDTRLVQNEKYRILFKINAHTSNIFSTYWNNFERTYKSDFLLDIKGKLNKKTSFRINPSIQFKKDQDDFPLFGVFQINYNKDSVLETTATFSRSGRLLSASEMNLLSTLQINSANKIHDNIKYYEIQLKRNFRDSSIKISSFYYKTNDSFNLYFDLNQDPGVDILSAVKFQKHSSISNQGVSLEAVKKISDFSTLQIHYSFQGGNKEKITAPEHSAFVRVNLNNLEDYVTSKMVDTKIYLTGYYVGKQQQLTFLPVYQKFVHTLLETPSVFGLKGRASARFQTLEFFYELDLLSRSNYQQVWGYPIPNKRIRIGLTWDFTN